MRVETEKWLFIPYDDNDDGNVDMGSGVDLKIWAYYFCYDYKFMVYVKRDTLPENSIFL